MFYIYICNKFHNTVLFTFYSQLSFREIRNRKRCPFIYDLVFTVSDAICFFKSKFSSGVNSLQPEASLLCQILSAFVDWILKGILQDIGCGVDFFFLSALSNCYFIRYDEKSAIIHINIPLAGFFHLHFWFSGVLTMICIMWFFLYLSYLGFIELPVSLIGYFTSWLGNIQLWFLWGKKCSTSFSFTCPSRTLVTNMINHFILYHKSLMS